MTRGKLQQLSAECCNMQGKAGLVIVATKKGVYMIYMASCNRDVSVATKNK